jgi:hypothetical protein
VLAVERDCEFCWQELHRAIDSWEDGTRAKIRAISALSKWRKDYDKQWDDWLARGNKKLPEKLRTLQEFAAHSGQVHFVAGEGKHFGTAREAQKYLRGEENSIASTDAEQWYHSDTNQQLTQMFDRAVADKRDAVWAQLAQALKQISAEDQEVSNEGRDSTEDR